jgi:hypothetical protein
MEAESERDSGRLFIKLAFALAILLAIVGFFAGLATSIWAALIIGFSFFALTLGASFFIGFVVKLIFKRLK